MKRTQIWSKLRGLVHTRVLVVVVAVVVVQPDCLPTLVKSRQERLLCLSHKLKRGNGIIDDVCLSVSGVTWQLDCLPDA